MSALLAIASREVASAFRTPVGWVVIALFSLLGGIVFVAGLTPGEPASMRTFFSLSEWLLLPIAPAISMRLIADERRVGTLETLVTAPVSDWQVAVGKYLGALVFLALMLAPSLIYTGVLEWLSDPDLGPILAGYLGLLLVGMLYLAVGLLASTLTESQVVAFLGTLFFFLIVWLGGSQLAPRVPDAVAEVLYALSVFGRLGDFAKGIIDTEHIVFFVVTSCWFVALSAVALEIRRWA
ncbi:MAG: ABC transporter permease subunit [Planctomycetota bacterium]